MLVQEPIHVRNITFSCTYGRLFFSLLFFFKAAIWHCLNHYAYRDAIFLSERLFAEIGSDEALHLLATCYYRSGKLNQAYDLLRKHDSKTPENRFLLAKCCLDLDQ